MSLTAIIGLIIATIAALIGGVAGKAIGRSSGRKEGADQAKSEQQVEQAKVIVDAIQERANVEVELAADSDDELDRRLQKHDRLR